MKKKSEGAFIVSHVWDMSRGCGGRSRDFSVISAHPLNHPKRQVNEFLFFLSLLV